MTLEDDNKPEPETPTNSSPATVAPAATAESSASDVVAVPTSPTSLSGCIKTKRSFDEISNSQPTSTTSEDGLVADGAAALEAENEETNMKMIIDETTAVDTTSAEEAEPIEVAPVPLLATFKVVYAKIPYEVSLDLNSTVADLKAELFKLTGVTSAMQKLCYRGNLDDHKTLQESGIKDGVKIMLIGSKIDDVKALAESKPEITKTASKEKAVKEPLCQQKQHKKIIDKGVPEYATLGWINEDCDLPPEPLTGMVNKYGNKVRLTFKFETDEVWIGTKENTQKLPMTNVKSVISEPIIGHPEYHLMGLQVGPTEASRIWFYWVPAQYVRAIKRAILND